MGDKRREKNKLFREAILKLINRSEDEFKAHDASIREMIPVSDHYGTQVRIFDVFYQSDFQIPTQKIQPSHPNAVCDHEEQAYLYLQREC